MADYAVTLEFLIDDAWVDVTRIDDSTRILHGNDGSPLNIQYGAQDEAPHAETTQIDFDYLDITAVMDSDNPLSEYWGKIVKGTHARVAVDGIIRATLEVNDIVPSWEDGTNNVIVQFATRGLFNRLGEGQTPVRSSLTRYYQKYGINNSLTKLRHWWKMEGGSADQISTIPSDHPGGAFLRASVASAGSSEEGRVSGVVGGDVDGPPGSAGALNVSGGGQLQARLTQPQIPRVFNEFLAVPSLQQRVEGAFKFDNPVDAVTGTGSIVRFRWASGFMGQMFTGGFGTIFEAFDDAGTVVSLADGPEIRYDDGNWHHLSINIETATVGALMNGADVTIWIDDYLFYFGPLTGLRHYEMSEVVINASGEMGAVTQWAVWKGYEGVLPDDVDGLPAQELGYRMFTGNSGETAINRIRDLEDEGIAVNLIDGGLNSNRNLVMGAGNTATVLDSAIEGARVGQGIMSETIDAPNEVDYRPLGAMYNQIPVVTLDYADVLPGLVGLPTPPNLVNELEVSDTNGNSTTIRIPDGDPYHYTTEAPPNGSYLRDQAESFNAGQDTELYFEAEGTVNIATQVGYWWMHLRSWREKRYVVVGIELAKLSAPKRAALLALRLGDVIAINTSDKNVVPRWIYPYELRLMVRGWTDQLGKRLHTLYLNTTPADAYEVEMTNADGSRLVTSIDDNDTSLRVAPGNGLAWSVTPAIPYYISIGGEAMKVTNTTDDTIPSLSVGVAATGNNASLVPAFHASAAAGDLLICVAAIRNSGTGTVDLPAGWTDMVNYGNLRVFGRYMQAGDTAPTVTFTGGVANADTIAQIADIGNCSLDEAGAFSPLNVYKQTPGSANQLNASAQNPTYPAYYFHRANSLALIIAWVQDDTTTLSTPAGFSNVGMTSTTTGDDATLAWRFQIQTTATNIAAGTLTRTGGAAAISRSIVIGLRPTQTMTVERGVNGPAAAHLPMSAVNMWRPGVVAL